MDAGGLKGLYQIRIITGIEEKYKYCFNNSFDIYSGTSIGGVIAIFLACKIPIQELINEFYKSKSNSNNSYGIFKHFFDWITSRLNNRFFGEISTRVILPVYNFTTKELSHFGINSPTNCDEILISDIIKAICTDFRITKPHNIIKLNNEFIDAGFCAYDPTIYIMRNQWDVNSKILLLSIGSGYIKNITNELNRDDFFDLMYDTIIFDQFSTNNFIANIIDTNSLFYYRISEPPNFKDSISLEEIFKLATERVAKLDFTKLDYFF